MAIREGRWDCASCGLVANLGRDLRCAGCGRPRGKVRFYLPANEPAVVDAERLAQAQAGPDWICAYCQASNRSTSAACTGCGAPREEGAARVRGGTDATELTEAQIEERERRRRQMGEALQRQRENARRAQKLVLACFAIFMLLGCTGMTGAAFVGRWGGTKGVGGPAIRFGAPSGGGSVELVEKMAVRRIDVEAQRLVQENDWCDRMPSDGRVIRRTTQQRGSRQVCAIDERSESGLRASAKREQAIESKGPLLGLVRLQEDMGNGYFEDSGSSGGGDSGSSDWGSGGSSSSCTTEPVYDDYCYWEAWRWHVVRAPETSDTVRIPAWPAVSLQRGEREGARSEMLEGVFQTSDGERVRLQTEEGRWLTWRPGERYSATWSWFGGLKEIGPPAS